MTVAAAARVEVCIANAGLAGLIAGYFLARDKRSVTVLDEASFTGPLPPPELGQLASVPRQSCYALEQRHGAQGARVAAQGFAAAIDAIEAIVRRERIACDFERLDGYCLFPPDEDRRRIEREVAAARSAGVKGAQALPASPVEGALAAPCMHHPGLAMLYPARLRAGIARAIMHEGGRVHGGVGVRSVDADVRVTPPPGPGMPAPLAHAIALRVPRGSVPRALYWDADSGRCARLRTQGMRSSDVLVAAGFAGEENAPFEALERWVRLHFPCAREVLQRLSGESPRSPGALLLAGREADDANALLIDEAACGTPLTRATIAAMVIHDVVAGNRSAAEFQLSSSCYTDATHRTAAREFA